MTEIERLAVEKVLAHVEREDGFLDVASVEDKTGRVFWEARCEIPLADSNDANRVLVGHGQTPLAAIVALAGGLP